VDPERREDLRSRPIAAHRIADFDRLSGAQDKVSEDEARKRGIAMMVPGVILQPSGVFACIRAQEAGCTYVKAS